MLISDQLTNPSTTKRLRSEHLKRFWSILFYSVPILATVTFLMASWGVWPFAACELPESLSSAGQTIDHLFYGIHALSMLILLGTGVAIGWVIWKFDHRRDPNRKAAYFNHNTKLEVLWTLVPAAILVALAFYQMNSWAENKMNRPMVTDVSGKSIPKPPLVMVKARQFGWEFHYAGDDGITETADDLYIENLLVVPVGEDIVLQLESRDVIHSFFVAELRLKQDIVPGKTQFAWFNPIRPCEVDILCTELCGWGHYKMKARLRVVTRDEFDVWLKELKQEYQPAALLSAVKEDRQIKGDRRINFGTPPRPANSDEKSNDWFQEIPEFVGRGCRGVRGNYVASSDYGIVGERQALRDGKFSMVEAPHPLAPSPREFGQSLIASVSGSDRINEERGNSIEFSRPLVKSKSDGSVSTSESQQP